MNCKFTAVGIIFVFLIVGFCGCIEDEREDVSDNEKFKLVSYTVESWKGESGVGEEKIDDGFILTEDVNQYRIYGTVKNLVNDKIDVLITFNFYAVNDFYLDSYTMRVDNISGKNEKTFYHIFLKDEINHFKNVHNVTLEVEDI
jgi:hypothetical protein